MTTYYQQVSAAYVKAMQRPEPAPIEEDKPHCERRQSDLDTAMDEMGEYAIQHPENVK